jgi:hypothetical protein
MFTEQFLVQIGIILVAFIGNYVAIQKTISVLQTDVKWIKQILTKNNL